MSDRRGLLFTSMTRTHLQYGKFTTSDIPVLTINYRQNKN
jgi:hypothetical protein